MKLPRLSIAKLMVVMVVVAVNFAAARALLAYSYPLFVGAAPIGLALQVGLFRLIRGRDQARKFCLGFVAFGSMVMLSFIWGMVFSPTGRPSTGRMIYASSPGSTMWTLWHGYFQFFVTTLDPLPGSTAILGIGGGELPIVTAALMWFLPQLLIAVVGGLLTRLIPGRHRRPDRPGGLPVALEAM